MQCSKYKWPVRYTYKVLVRYTYNKIKDGKIVWKEGTLKINGRPSRLNLSSCKLFDDYPWCWSVRSGWQVDQSPTSIHTRWANVWRFAHLLMVTSHSKQILQRKMANWHSYRAERSLGYFTSSIDPTSTKEKNDKFVAEVYESGVSGC